MRAAVRTSCAATRTPQARLSLCGVTARAPFVWHRQHPYYFVEIPSLPSASETIEDIVQQPWTVQTLIEKEHEREAEGDRARSLRELIEDLEDEVLANAGDVFEEVFKLIFTKLYDEMATYHTRVARSSYGSATRTPRRS